MGQCFSLRESLTWHFAGLRCAAQSPDNLSNRCRSPTSEAAVLTALGVGASCAFWREHLSDEGPQLGGLERLGQNPVGSRGGAGGEIGDG